MRNSFASEHGVDPAKIVLITPCVDLRRFDCLPSRSTIRGELGFSQEEFLIGMVAEFRGEKDHPTLLRAFRRVLDQVGHAKLLLAGGGGGGKGQETPTLFPRNSNTKGSAFD
jgi:glycosyltransferase involved in cell wall biosynthesis